MLVTGSSGFVGRRLIPRLSRNFEVQALGGPDLADARPMVDLLDERALDEAVAAFGPGTIVHLAAASSVAGAGQAPDATWDVNLIGTRNLVRAARRTGAPVHFIFASTAEVYGRAFLNGPCSEDTPPQPVSVYGRSKLAAEYLLEDLAGGGFSVTILRLFNHTGVGQDQRFVVPSFAAQVAAAETGRGATNEVRVGNLEARRDFSDVDDVLEAYAAIAAAPPHEGVCRYNVGSDSVRSVRSILDDLVSQARSPVRVVEDPKRFRAVDIEAAQGDFSRIQEAFGWRAAIPFERTLSAILADQRARLVDPGSSGLKN